MDTPAGQIRNGIVDLLELAALVVYL